MSHLTPHDETSSAPPAFRDALAELVQVGMRVARMVGQIADAETALAVAATQAGAAEGVSAIATSLAEAIEADRATAAAAEARHTVVARTEAVAAAFALVSRSIRLTIVLAERLDRGWARPRAADGRQAMARRQIARLVADVIAREAEGERAVQLTEALADRLETLDTENEFRGHAPQAIVSIICRDIGLDPVRRTVQSPLPGAVSLGEAAEAAPLPEGWIWKARPKQRRPDG